MSIVLFIEAVKAGNLPQTRVLLGDQPDLVVTDVSGGDEHRALHFAVLQRDLPMVTLLLEAGADPRQGIFPHRDATSAFALAHDRDYSDIVAAIEDEEHRRRKELSCPNATVSPVQDRITQAIGGGDKAAAIRLLEEDGSLIQACDRRGGTPLHSAAEAGNIELVEWLLARRAPLNKEDVRGLTALDRAALSLKHQAFAAVAHRLLQGGATLTIRAAVALPNESRVRELLEADPSLLQQIDNDGGLVTLAVRQNQTGMARLLLDLGADVDERISIENVEVPTPSWGMPLWHAALAGNLEISQLLLDRGADPNANVYASGWPLRNAWPHEDPSVKKLLLERGARLQPHMVAENHDVAEADRLLAEDPSEEVVHELLWAAAQYGCEAIVERALPRLPWALDDGRWHWVMMQPPRGASGVAADNEGQFKCLGRLLRHGIDPNVARFGQTPLHFIAAYRGPIPGPDRARFAGLLLDHGARLDVRDDLLESTPIAWAARWGRAELFRLLLSRGAPAQEPDAKPWAQPEAWARRMGHETIVAEIRNHLGNL